MVRISPLTLYRLNEKLTLEGLAMKFRVNKTTVMRWENGVVQVPAERVPEIERKTGIPRHELRPDLWSKAEQVA